jgi:hypothetical protein
MRGIGPNTVGDKEQSIHTVDDGGCKKVNGWGLRNRMSRTSRRRSCSQHRELGNGIPMDILLKFVIISPREQHKFIIEL